MIKKIFLILAFTFGITNSYACEVCAGGSMGNTNLWQQGFLKHIIGLQWNYSKFKADQISNRYSDSFHQINAIGNFQIKEDWRLTAVIPIQFAKRTEMYRERSLSGLGDIVLSAQYKLLNQIPLNENIQLYVGIGAGAILPTGQFNDRIIIEDNLPMEMNAGRGQWGMQFSVESNLQFNNWGIHLLGSMNRRFEDQQLILFGNEYLVAPSFYYSYSIGKSLSWSPFIRTPIQILTTDKYKSNDSKVHDSEKKMMSVEIGNSIQHKNWNFNFVISKVILKNITLDNLQAKPGVELSLHYFL